jgi:hypothetical protein
MRFRSLSLACLAVFTVAGAGCDDLQDILDAARAAHDKGGGTTQGGTGGTSAGPGAPGGPPPPPGSGTGGASAGPGMPGTPPPPTACVTREQGGSTSCKTTFTWKSYASEDCQQSGMILIDYSLHGDCNEKDAAQFVSYTCCPNGGPYPPPTTPPLPPGACNSDADCRLVVGLCTKCECTVRSTSESPMCDGDPPGPQCNVDSCANQAAICTAGRCAMRTKPPPVCETRKLGGATACKSASDWKALADADCTQSGLQLQGYSSVGDCAGGSPYVTYSCCKY